MIIEWIRFLAAGVLMISGLSALLVTTIGVFRFNYVLNRIHIAAKCDTLGILLVISSLIIVTGFNVSSLKMLLLVIFLWLSNPVSSHLIAYLEVATNPDIENECEVIPIDSDDNTH